MFCKKIENNFTRQIETKNWNNKKNETRKNWINKKCPKILSFECDIDYCSSNKKACESIKNLKFIIRAYTGLILFEKELNYYYKFIRMISNCSKNIVENSKKKIISLKKN